MSLFLIKELKKTLPVVFNSGHFGRWPVRTSWLFVVLPSVMINYLGQGALIMNHPEYISNPFYNASPMWARWPLIILATMATSKFISTKNSLFFLKYHLNIFSYCFSSNHYRCFFISKSSSFSWLFTTITCYTYEYKSDRSNLCSCKIDS
jgi:hypothetical protein